MSSLHRIVGCALAAVFVAPVMAAPRAAVGASVQDTMAQGSANCVSRNVDTGTSGGTLPGARHPAAAASSSTGNDSSGDATDNAPLGGSDRQMPLRRSSLGWQSLLPGSIQ